MNETCYLLPIIQKRDCYERQQYKSAIFMVNRSLT